MKKNIVKRLEIEIDAILNAMFTVLQFYNIVKDNQANVCVIKSTASIL